MSESLVIISSRDTDLFSAGLAIAGQDHRLVIHEDPAETLVAAQASDVALVVLDVRHYTDFPESLVTRVRVTPAGSTPSGTRTRSSGSEGVTFTRVTRDSGKSV